MNMFYLDYFLQLLLAMCGQILSLLLLFIYDTGTAARKRELEVISWFSLVKKKQIIFCGFSIYSSI